MQTKNINEAVTVNLLSWICRPRKKQWDLMVRGQKYPRATVFDNGVWHTWDRQGTGGENSHEETVDEAKRQAAGAAVLQGFI